MRRGKVIGITPDVTIIREPRSRRGNTFVYRNQFYPPGIPANEAVPGEELLAAENNARRQCGTPGFEHADGGFRKGWLSALLGADGLLMPIDERAGWLACHIHRGPAS